ncbi:MAG: tRNA (adenosine(37)-N6)-threonylcarbamoyltransferase complex dimerization subunit type 1 TsaB [Lachnospiraceae bacterium]|nr:tRNA (adenosine(37)-N6)-threonylcarbamoyltransferase complex dimerization subunit type 1 TsaB [Lachnospiraceae bacterium]
MRILALDSSSLVASAAIVEDDILMAEYTINYKKTHSQTLLPMVDEIVKMTELDLHTIDAIAISRGPGSFTGLRIGSATVKGLGLVLEKPIVAVPTTAMMAFNFWGSQDKLIVPILDARRNQVYAGVYCFQDKGMDTVLEDSVMEIEKLVFYVDKEAQGKKVIFLGDGVPVYKEKIKETIISPYQFAPAHMNRQRAGSLGVLAQYYYREGKIESAADHKPEYLRMSQAERERKEKEAKQ